MVGLLAVVPIALMDREGIIFLTMFPQNQQLLF